MWWMVGRPPFRAGAAARSDSRVRLGPVVVDGLCGVDAASDFSLSNLSSEERTRRDVYPRNRATLLGERPELR